MKDLNFPICILKMNLQCCQDCPSRVKKLLRKVTGVYAIIIDPTKGLILVSGTAEPLVLIKAIERIGQSPQLYAYEKNPAKAKTQFRALLQRYAAEEHRGEPPAIPAATTGSCHLESQTLGGFRQWGTPLPLPPPASMMMQMPMFTLPRTIGPPGWLAPGPRPRYMVRYEQPTVMTREPPAPYPFDFYETKEFPAANSLFHYFSDENAHPCTII